MPHVVGLLYTKQDRVDSLSQRHCISQRAPASLQDIVTETIKAAFPHDNKERAVENEQGAEVRRHISRRTRRSERAEHCSRRKPLPVCLWWEGKLIADGRGQVVQEPHRGMQ
ncbi:hypothetical protein MHYP_G00137460 [Metynnis hypsauchen]